MRGPDAPWIFYAWQLENSARYCRQHDRTRRIQKLSGSDRRRVTQSRRVKHSVENKQACLTVKQATSHKRTKTYLQFSAFRNKNGQCQRHQPSFAVRPKRQKTLGSIDAKLLTVRWPLSFPPSRATPQVAMPASCAASSSSTISDRNRMDCAGRPILDAIDR